jgi:hypothetical protein
MFDLHQLSYSFTGEDTGTGPVPVYRDRPSSDPPKTPVRGGLFFALLQKPRSGVVSFLHKRRPEPETGDRPVTGFWYFLKIRSVTMADSDPDEDGWEEVSCEEQQNSEGDDDVEEVEASGSRASAKPILRLTERKDEDTAWTRTVGTKSTPNYNTPVKDLEYKDLLTITFTVQTSSKS